MKKYFEYPFDESIKERLLSYYNDPRLEQHAKQDAKMGVKLNRIKKMIDFSYSDDVLDVGCSSGFLLKKIEQSISSGVGIDISSPVIELSNQNNKKKLSFYCFDGINIPDFQKKFDKIFLIDVLEHSFYPDQLIEEIGSKLKSGGQLIVEVPFSGWLSELVTKRYHQGHLRYYDSGYLTNFLKKYGFEIEKTLVYNSVPLAGLWLRFRPLWIVFNVLVNLIPSKVYPYFGEILIVVNKK